MLDYSQWPQAYHPDFGQLVSYRFEAMPDDPDAQVRIAVERVTRLVLQDVNEPIIQQSAARALELGGGDPILGVWKSIKPHIRFRQDADIAMDLQVNDVRKRDIVETFIPPAQQAQLIYNVEFPNLAAPNFADKWKDGRVGQVRGKGVEDCDGFTNYGACLLLALGVPITMCTVSAERGERERLFSHIYTVAYWNGMRIPMDLSHGPHVGWECPNTGRKREWPVTAEAIRPSIFFPLLLATAVGGYLAWKAGH